MQSAGVAFFDRAIGRIPRGPRTILLIVALAFGASGCEEEEPNEAEDLARLEAMERRIRDYIGEAPCSDSTECAILPLGAKPCGGPWGFLVYSKTEVDSTELARLAREYTEFNRTLNKRWGYVSDCGMQPIPQIACKDGRCVDLLSLYDGGIPP